VTAADVFAELGRLEGSFVTVAIHPTGEWYSSALHAQGRLQQHAVDQPKDGIAFGIGKAHRLNNDWAEFELLAADIEEASWRTDLVAGGRVLAVRLRGGALLTVAP
jgi:hypothetical protein